MLTNLWQTPLSRRELLRLAILGAAAGFFTGCDAASGDRRAAEPPQTALAHPAAPPTSTATATPSPTATPAPTATPTPAPFVIAAGEQRVPLMAETRYETPLHIIGSGLPGQVLLLLGGVHGNEPGGWLAAERLLATLRPTAGAVLIIPHANRLAAPAFVRTREEWGDLNRLYPGATDGLPMAQMAWQITQALREYRVNVVLDMHESWAYFNGRPQNGTAYLGQTVATSSDERAKTLAREAVAAVNTRIRHPWEELFDRNNPNNPPARNGGPPTAGGGIPNAGRSVPGGTSSLGLPRTVPGLSVLLVEMGQQQDLERRIALHVEIANEVALRLGIT